MNRQRAVNMMQETPFTFPAVLFQCYKQLGLTDMQFLVLQHIHQLHQEGIRLPSPAQISDRMTAPIQECSRHLKDLMGSRFIEIKEIEESDKQTGKEVIVEEISLGPVFEKLYECLSDKDLEEKENTKKTDEGELFETFETEFARPLSPMEMEMISMWLDEDGHDTDLIAGALKESVISGKLNFRYIDRILHDWKRNGIKNLEAAKKHGESIRSRRLAAPEVKAAKPHPGYNWLEGGNG
ncbi:DnaD domain-containing protein [Alkalicoccus saliphilus]|nr:DnaD domain-containing protein [Alkalicoccus saliphilus]